MSTPQVEETLHIAVCIWPDVQLIDFAAPIDILGALEGSNRTKHWVELGLEPPHKQLEFRYIAPEKTLVVPLTGPAMMPDETYDEVVASGRQYDVVLVPGGVRRPEHAPPSLIKFVAAQTPGAKHVLSVCTGSWVLAMAGVLDGRRATTNKAAFRIIEDATSKKIEWVSKARWVVDDNIWTSSGASAGLDMTCAWLENYIGAETANKVQAMIEYTARKQDDDEWSAVWGLVPPAK